MDRIRSLIGIFLVAALCVLPASAAATPPQRGHHYIGRLATQKTDDGRILRYDISFYVEGSGEDIEQIEFNGTYGPGGIPFSLDCALGPLGSPFHDIEAPISGQGTIDSTFRLLIPEEEAEDHGNIRLEGAFKPKGRFAGTFRNQTTEKQCRVNYDFTMHVQPE